MSSFRPTLNLRLRILTVALLPLLLAVGLFAAFFAHRSVSQVEEALMRRGQDSAHHLSNAVAFDLFSNNLPAVKRLLDYERDSREIEAIAITDGARWLLVSGAGPSLPALENRALPARWRRGPLLFFSDAIRLPANAEADPYLALAEAGKPLSYIVVALNRAPVELTRSQVGIAAASVATLSILLALVLAWRLAGGVSEPLHAITASVADLANGNLATRTPETSHGEIGMLEHGVNRMAEALAENRRSLELRIQEATAELLGQKLAAEAAVLAKSRFLAAASHDLRQPLHALTLLVAALRERAPDGETRRLAVHIEASAAAMESLLNALLDLSKLDAGVVEARPQCFPLGKVFANLANQFLPLAQARDIELRVMPSSLWAFSDPALVERILANLISNALRYTERGRVLVGARRVDQDWLRLEVWDTGKGIPEEFQDRIFEEYFQMENPERHRDKGLGLGLAIVARLARLLGGRVQVQSRIGRGSRFSFRCARCRPEPRQTVESQAGFVLPLENVLVAFIDDDQAILEAMVVLFDQWHVALAVGEDAAQVRGELQALRRAPDIILSDYRLRGHSGVEAIRLLREAFGPEIPAALLTGDTASDTIQAIKASGLPVLHKPLKPAKLRAFLSHLLADRPSQR